jgi:hypothetical protein
MGITPAASPPSHTICSGKHRRTPCPMRIDFTELKQRVSIERAAEMSASNSRKAGRRFEARAPFAKRVAIERSSSLRRRVSTIASALAARAATQSPWRRMSVIARFAKRPISWPAGGPEGRSPKLWPRRGNRRLVPAGQCLVRPFRLEWRGDLCLGRLARRARGKARHRRRGRFGRSSADAADGRI